MDEQYTHDNLPAEEAAPQDAAVTAAAAEAATLADPALLEEECAAPAPETVRVVDIHFRSGGKVYYFDPGELPLVPGKHVIIDTARGLEFGICASGPHQVPVRDVVPPLRPVVRLATAADEKTVAENREKEKRAFEICQQKIADHGLEMQLVSAECAFDGSKILFFFTADGRVDFRELVKNLASVFRTRIELRQIGVRDKAKMVGGLGVCGRPFCCSEFLDDFQPVSIKMAKVQNLSLNPTKISGTCGRLMCCLKYEQEAYEDLLKTSPKAESFVDTPDGRGTVTEVNLLRQSVKVRMEKQPEVVGCYKNCEICVLRNGKARKTDPPIPDDLAPISGNGVRRKAEPEEETFPVLEEVRIKSEMPQPEAEPKKRSRSRSRSRSHKPAAEQSNVPAAETAEARPEGRSRRRSGKSRPAAHPAEAAPQPRPEGKARPSGSKPHHRRRSRGGKGRSAEGQKPAE